MKVGLALSGGGAKGLAHIGVLKALEDYDINIDYISGTSSGGIIAAFYAAGYSPSEILNIIHRNGKNIIDADTSKALKLVGSVITKKVSINGIIKGDKLEYEIKKALSEIGVSNIKDVVLPLAIPVINLSDGNITYYISKECENTEQKDINYINYGKLHEIVRASCSIPGIFVPKKIENNYYIDGGVRVNTPVSVLKDMGADRIIAVTFKSDDKLKLGVKNVCGISNLAFHKMQDSLNEYEIGLANVNICLKIQNVGMFDVSKLGRLANFGYDVVKNNIEKIKEYIKIDNTP